VPSHASRDADPDSRDLAILDPYPRRSRTPRARYRQHRKASNQHLLQQADIGLRPGTVCPEVEDGICHDLAGPVISHRAAAIGHTDRNPIDRPPFPRCSHVLRTRCPTERIHWKVLGENQHILDAMRGAGLVYPELDLAGVLIRRQSQIKESTLRRQLYRARATSESAA
jgi:hypothetical protein